MNSFINAELIRAFEFSTDQKGDKFECAYMIETIRISFQFQIQFIPISPLFNFIDFTKKKKKKDKKEKKKKKKKKKKR